MMANVQEKIAAVGKESRQNEKKNKIKQQQSMQRTQKEKKWSRLKKHEIAKRHQKKKIVFAMETNKVHITYIQSLAYA